MTSAAVMTIAKGVSVGPYEILSQIGAGGMGEVWRARDRRIGRDVAVKVLPEEFNDEAVKRFEQEARAAGALNHPGLVTIFDVGTTADHSPYIVMELLEGQTLRDALGDEVPVALPLRKAIDYAVQIASALAVAHEKGIIHRDLKPENLFITADRRVKILDFGLAKLAADAKDADGRKRSTKNLTAAGIAIGTPAYMSPEQVRADPIDHRTDIFSLGTVLYEMLAGKPAFECFSAVETMHAVLTDEPAPLESLVPNISPALATIVHHCLEKDPRERFQSARDLAFQLRMLPEMQRSMTGTHHAPVGRKLPYRAGILVLPLILAAALGGFLLRGIRGSAASSVPRTYKQLTFADGLEIFPTLAPDGKSFAYVASQSGNRDIYVQRVDGRTAINITSDSQADDSEPAFSPDGSLIAFRSEREGGGIFVMGVTGESVRRLTNEGHNPSWSPDGKRIAYSTAATELKPNSHALDGALWVVDVGGGGRKKIYQRPPNKANSTDALQPNWSPHGKRIAFWGVKAAAAAQRDIWTIDPDAAQPGDTLVAVTADTALDWNPIWSPDGDALYFGSDRDTTLNLWRVEIDEESGKPRTAPQAVSLPSSFTGNFAMSQHGELAFASLTRFFHVIALPFDASNATVGAPQTLFGGSQEILSFEPSPDRQSVAFTTGAPQEDVYIANVDGTRLRQLTNDAARDRSVTWSPDGKTLYFYSNRGGSYDLWSIQADGSGLNRVTKQGDVYSAAVSPDGRTLVTRTVKSPTALVHLDRPIDRRIEPLPLTLGDPRWSPDGKQLLGVHRRQIVLCSLAARRLEPLFDGGSAPQWLPDGKHIVFFDKQQLAVLDLERRTVTRGALPASMGGDLDDGARVSRDGSMIYIRQTSEQGDVWMMRLEKE